MEKAVFLDRDGVINRDLRTYVRSWDEFEFLPGARAALVKLAKSDFKVFVVSNQAGVGKGLLDLNTLDVITNNMLGEIEQAAGRVDAVKYCPHRSDENCECRKPKTGLFRQILRERKIDVAASFMVGDSERDMAAGRELGLKTILVLCGHIKDKKETVDFKIKPDYISRDLLDAVDNIILKDE
ncbi:MAG: D-glycero-beta-D-manno-heptose 1,7-bisphosphate 7-phosphatase [Candidatus Omnitrophota bacterium]